MAPSKDSAAASPSQKSKNGDENHEQQPLWRIAEIEGKGKALLATGPISPGTQVISESPLLTTEHITSPDEDTTERDLEGALSKLSLSNQTAYRALHNNFASDTAHTFSGIVRSNAYPLGVDSDHGGVFEVIARINHSCLPNVVQYWNVLEEKEEVHAVRWIKEGEEITTSYHQFGPSRERKEVLRKQFGFECMCVLCSLPEDELRKSDERLRRAEELDKCIGSSKACYEEPERVLKACREVSLLFEQEGIKDGRLPRLYYDAFQLCNLHGDLARARCFAKYYCDAKTMAEGKDSINVLEMKLFVKNPAKHGSYEPRGKWRSGTGDVPRGLSSKEFARWLWRENA